jgi:Metallo-beta-lactamase superfamily
MMNRNLTRRNLLAGASATAAASFVATALPAVAKAPLLKTQAPAFYRFNVGNIQATVASDGLIVGVPKTTFVGPAATNVERMMTDLFLPPDKLVMDQNALVINTGDKLALFETGMASVKRTEDMGLLVGNLKAAGIDPKDIDYLIPSHAHIDHIGGILAAVHEAS